jgi:osmotically-inducible protein OsmY
MTKCSVPVAFANRERVSRKEDDVSTTLTPLDERLCDMVTRQLAWDPQVDATMIGVTNKDGIVTLSGYVDTYAGCLAAERAARRVYGVKAVANELAVKLADDPIDPDIAETALHVLANRVDVPRGITVTVRDGHIRLGGTVEWHYQRLSAERAVKYLRGVRGVFNNIAVKPSESPKDVQRRIVEALNRHADIDARRIHVFADGPRVVLSGFVRSWNEKDEAYRAAWTAPGVSIVDDRIAVIP